MPRSRAFAPLVAVCGAQLVIAAVGLAVVSGDDGKPSKGDVAVSQPGDTTTTGGGPSFDLGTPGGDTTTTTAAGVAGATSSIAPVTSGGAATTTTLAASTTTTKALPAKAPGAQGIPKVGSYGFDVTTTDSDGKTSTSSGTTEVTDGGSPGGVPHRMVKGDAAGTPGTNTVGFRPEGVYVEKTVVDAQGSTFECDWNPDFPVYVAPMQVGTTWKYTTVCTGTFKGGQLDGSQARIDNTTSNKVTGTDTRAVGGKAYGTWIIAGTSDVIITFTSGLAAGQKITTHSVATTHYSPELSTPMYTEGTSTASAFGQSRTGKATSVLKSVP